MTSGVATPVISMPKMFPENNKYGPQDNTRHDAGKSTPIVPQEGPGDAFRHDACFGTMILSMLLGVSTFSSLCNVMYLNLA